VDRVTVVQLGFAAAVVVVGASLYATLRAAIGTRALAGLAGVVGTPIIGLDPLVPEEVLILSLVVVVIGGLGRLSGAVLGALVVGPARTFGNLLLPEFSLAFIFMVMAGVLLLRPTGLFGRR
jgi:branched-chain amino acid transport system permease protein